MKERRLRKHINRVISDNLILVGVVFSSLVGFLFSLVYYFHMDKEADVIFGFYYSVMNTMKMLSFAPVISLKDAKTLLDVYPMLTYFYGAAVLLGPGCMLTAIIVSFFSYVHNIARKWYVMSPKRVYVFGYNKESRQLVSKLCQEGKRVIWIVRENLKKDEKEKILFNNKVYFVEKDLVTLNVDDDIEENMNIVKRIFNRNGLAGAESIILYEKEETLNFELYLKLAYYYKECKKMNVKCSIYCENDYMIKNIDRLNQLEKQLDICFFDLHDIAVQMMFDAKPIYQKKLKNNLNWDIHFLLIGFGRYGKAVLKQVLYRSALSFHNNIVIDVLEKNPKDKIKAFTRFISKETYVLENQGMTIRIREEYMDGTLEIRFHEVDVTHREFLEVLKDIAKSGKNELDYAAITLSNSELSLQCMEEVRQVFGEDTIVAIQLDEGDMLNEYCDRLNGEVYSFGNLKKTLTYENIFRENMMEKAKKKYYAYINKPKHDNSDKWKQKWSELSFEEKMVNYHATFNDNLYYKRLSMLLNTKDESVLAAFVEQREQETCEESKNDIVYQELCSTEHKRWFLNKWLGGYYYLSKEHQKKDRLANENMVRFSEMDADMIRKDWKNVKICFEKEN